MKALLEELGINQSLSPQENKNSIKALLVRLEGGNYNSSSYNFSDSDRSNSTKPLEPTDERLVMEELYLILDK